MLSRGVGDETSAPLIGDHHDSPAIDLIHLPWSPICVRDSSCYVVLDRDMCYCNGIRDKGGSSKFRPLEDCRMKQGEKIAQPDYGDNIGYFIKKKLHVWCQLPSGLWELGMIRRHAVLRSLTYNLKDRKAICHGLLHFVLAFSTRVNELVYDALLKYHFGWVNWYLVGKFVKKNFYALHLFDEISNLEALDIVVLLVITIESGIVYVQLDPVSFPNCVENDQNFQQPVEENGKRKGFGFVTAIIRLLEESANLKGLEDGHFGQEQDMFAILSCKHINDALKIKAELFPYNFQKLLPIVLFLPLVIEQDKAWKIAILFCDVALDTIVLQFLLEILSLCVLANWFKFTSSISKESKGAKSSNGKDLLGCCQKWSYAVENLLEKSTKVQLLDGIVVPLDDSSSNYIVQALHEMSTSVLKPLNDAPILKLADIGIAMGVSGIENMSIRRECATAFKQVPTSKSIRRECAAAFKQVPTSKFFSLVDISGIEVLLELKESAATFKQVSTISFLSLEDKANFQGGNIVMNPICS
ncbi:phytosulfokine receptor 2-like [Pyrus ussuriensis x Pyrus communis]|uniref:Phytosulfokine receptor 2-like n=1 Tax=Pyrus ussuriensis x Pyrus communis TaxID=2448454 RepID=A0A5N5GVP3_9ROSA|nr:phytosulfokine receptor 2-like [Pyrus ussuriensis x Pyrus communis]